MKYKKGKAGYDKPLIDVILLDESDVISTSSGTLGGDESGGEDPGAWT